MEGRWRYRVEAVARSPVIDASPKVSATSMLTVQSASALATADQRQVAIDCTPVTSRRTRAKGLPTTSERDWPLAPIVTLVRRPAPGGFPRMLALRLSGHGVPALVSKHGLRP